MMTKWYLSWLQDSLSLANTLHSAIQHLEDSITLVIPTTNAFA